MNHTHEHTHVSCHDYSHSFHHKTLFFSPCCKPCKLLCCVLHRFTHTLCRFELFFLIFRLQCFHWPTSFSTIFVMFIFRFILFMFGPTCASNITFYFFSGHNCISTKLVVCLVRLMPSTVCSNPMASSTWSCPKASMSLMWTCFTHATGLCVACNGLVSVG